MWSQWIAETGRACKEYGYTVNSRSPHKFIGQQHYLRYGWKRASFFRWMTRCAYFSLHIAYGDRFLSYQNANKRKLLMVGLQFHVEDIVQWMENCYSIIIFPIRHPKQLSQLYACGMVSFSPIAWRRTKDGSYLDLQRIIELMFCTVKRVIELMFCTVNLCQLNKSLVQTSPILGPWTHICTVIIISITLILIVPLEYLSR